MRIVIVAWHTGYAMLIADLTLAITITEEVPLNKRNHKNQNTKDLKLVEFLKSGGRKGALNDFNLVLKKAVGVKK